MDELDLYKKSKAFWYEQKIADSKSKVKQICKCGHSVIVPSYVKKVKCNWCGCYVFKNKQDEFNYKLEIAIRKKKYEQI